MDNITVRDAAIKDAGRLLEIYSYYVQHTAITFEYDVPTLSDFQNRIKNTKKKYPYIVIERDGQFRDMPMPGRLWAGPLMTGPVK